LQYVLLSSRYELTAEAYRENFRNSSQLSDETFKEFAVRLVGFLRHWLEREEIGYDFAKFAALVAREQLMVSCSKELKLWIKEQKPKTVDELIEKAEAFQQAHKNEHVSKPDQPKHPGKSFQYKENQAETRICFICQKAGHIATIVLQSQRSQQRVDINKVSLAYVYKLSMNILLMAIIVV
jgi:hypothetical protein